jgi:hypothetical protein
MLNGIFIPRVTLGLWVAHLLNTDKLRYDHYTMAMDVIVMEALKVGVYNYDR